jgi:mannose-6-phosphate isomerase-like protein (cupin superfamily)
MIDGATAGGSFALVEHPIAPRSLAAPLHRHTNEDEYSYVLEGRVGVQLGEETLEAGPGELVFKPRGQWHAFWNPGDQPARLLEIISPAGFERYFEEIAPLLPPNRPEPDFPALAEVRARYALELDPDSIGPLTERHGLTA